ncbi:MAG: outer membrane beta-barrel protein, partial [Chitinophagaceae bacterium]|nr:outer membrane beta-barrel protein [Chitinophagaceae bacterium]
MLSKILSILLLLLSALSAIAQQDSYFKLPDKNGQDKIFYAGLVAGINASQIDGDTYAGFHQANINAGLISFIKLKPNWYANIELLYSPKGARNVQVVNSPAVGSIPLIYVANLNYVEIPIMLHYQAQERILAGAGLSYNRLFSAKEGKDEIQPSGINNGTPNFKNQDIELLASISYQLTG